MIENEVITKYKKYFDENGCLDFLKLIEIINVNDSLYPLGVGNKDIADMNMLYSQICRKLGIEAPICFPVSTPVDDLLKQMGYDFHSDTFIYAMMASFPKRDNEEEFKIFMGDLIEKRPRTLLTSYLTGRKFFNKEIIKQYKELYDSFDKGTYISPVAFNKMYTINFCNFLKESPINFNEIGKFGTNLIVRLIYNTEKILLPHGRSFFECIFDKGIVPVYDFYNAKRIQDYFTQKAIKDKVTIALLDTAFLNTNRRQDTCIYRLNDNKEVERVIPIFFAEGTKNARNMARKDYDKVDNAYTNDFTSKSSTAEQVIEMYRKFSNVSQDFTLKDRIDLGIKMREVANSDVAGDIRDTIGYQIDKDLNDVVVHHLDKVGEELLK